MLVSDVEPQFGTELPNVRIRTGKPVIGSSKSTRAKAFAYGSDIVFACGQYRCRPAILGTRTGPCRAARHGEYIEPN